MSLPDEPHLLDAALCEVAARLSALALRENVPLSAAHGRILAQAQYASIALPGCDHAAVDGYAVASGDLNAVGETVLPVSAHITSGMRFVLPLHLPSSAASIAKGAPVPLGADTVFTREEAMQEGDSLNVPYGQEAGRNIHHKGQDFAIGAPVLPIGTRLAPHHLATFAALGVRNLPVYQPLRVVVFSTGNALLDPLSHQGKLPPGGQFDSARLMLLSLLVARGMNGIDLGILSDDPLNTEAALHMVAEECDVLLHIRDSSQGRDNRLISSLKSRACVELWELALKPAASLAMGQIKACPFISLSDDPLGAYITFTRFIGPLLDKLAGGVARLVPGLSGTAAFSYAKQKDRRDYLPATLHVNARGNTEVRLFPNCDSAPFAAFAGADGFVELPERVEQVLAGQSVPFLPFALLAAGTGTGAG